MVWCPIALQERAPYFSSVVAKIVRNVSRIGSVRHLRRYFVTTTKW
jgi:hypothetical protein